MHTAPSFDEQLCKRRVALKQRAAWSALMLFAALGLLFATEATHAQDPGTVQIRGCVRTTWGQPYQGASIVVRDSAGREQVWPTWTDIRGDFSVPVKSGSPDQPEAIEIHARSDRLDDPGTQKARIANTGEPQSLKECLVLRGHFSVNGRVRIEDYLPDSGDFGAIVRVDSTGMSSPEEFRAGNNQMSFHTRAQILEGTVYRATIIRQPDPRTYRCTFSNKLLTMEAVVRPILTEPPEHVIEIICTPLQEAVELCRAAQRKRQEYYAELEARSQAERKANPKGGWIEASPSALPPRAPEDVCVVKTRAVAERAPEAPRLTEKPPPVPPGVETSPPDPLASLPRRQGGGGLGVFKDAEQQLAMREQQDQGSSATPGAPVMAATGDPDADCRAAVGKLKPRYDAGLARASGTVQQLEAVMWLNVNAMAVIDRYCPSTAMGRQERVKLQQTYAEREKTCNGISSLPCIARLPGEPAVAAPAIAPGRTAGREAAPDATRDQRTVCTPGATYNAQACFCLQRPQGAGCSRFSGR